MSELWNIRAEITVQPKDFPSGDTVGFMNVITWADSAESARTKIDRYFAPFDWHIIGVEGSKVLSADFIADDDEFRDMFEQARTNLEAIICGTFYSYRVN